MPARARRPRPRLRAMPVWHLIPNILTLLGLCAGMTSIRYALDGRWQLAVALIIAAAVLDGLDGRSARMFNLTSKLGAQLDSLADFLSFGVAPAVLVYLWVLHDVRAIGWALAMLFAVCCALRLARFNTELEAPERPLWTHFFFTGIPAPAAAGLAIVPLMAWFVIGDGLARSWLLNAGLLVLIAALMVSRVPTFSLKRLRVPPHMVLPTLLAAFLVIAGLITETWLTFSALGVLYLGSIPVSVWVAGRMRRREPAAAAAPATGDAERVVRLERPAGRSG